MQFIWVQATVRATVQVSEQETVILNPAVDRLFFGLTP